MSNFTEITETTYHHDELARLRGEVERLGALHSDAVRFAEAYKTRAETAEARVRELEEHNAKGRSDFEICEQARDSWRRVSERLEQEKITVEAQLPSPKVLSVDEIAGVIEFETDLFHTHAMVAAKELHKAIYGGEEWKE
jgi:hypothetical protein